MRIAAISALMAVLILQPAATARHATDVRHAEPPLDEIIARFFEGYAPVTPGDLRAEIGRLAMTDPVYGDPERSPSVIHADFDGNGIGDYAILIRELAPQAPDEVFAVLMGLGDGRYRVAMKAFFGNLMDEVYLGYVPVGGQLVPVAGSGDPGEPVRLDHPAVTLTYFGRATDAFYWNAETGVFDSMPIAK